MMRLPVICLALILLATLHPQHLVAGRFRENIGEIELRNVMWQHLPPAVQRVYVDQADQTWYQLSPPRDTPDLDTVRDLIKREFPKAAPQIYGVNPVLFEPGGRAWFTAMRGEVLLGYDGKDFVELRGEKLHFLSCTPNHNYAPRRSNLYASGTAFFREKSGVLTFSGGEYSYQQMIPSGAYANVRSTGLYLEPDGEGVTALMFSGDYPVLWRWREGKWSRTWIPVQVDRRRPVHIAPVQGGVWLFSQRRAFYHSYDGSYPELFKQLLTSMGDARYAVRAEATRALIATGTSFLTMAERELEHSDDPEVRERLARVIEANKRPKTLAAQIGPYRLTEPQFELYDSAATFYVSARNIEAEGESLGPGLLVGYGHGEIKVITCSGFPARAPHSDGYIAPLVLAPGKQVWFSRRTGYSTPGLFDVDRGEWAADMPDARASALESIKSDGTVFVRGPSIAVFNPSAPNNLHILQSSHVELTCKADPRRWGSICVTSDGHLWANLKDSGLSWFDGSEWNVYDALPTNGVQELLPGINGSLIFTTEDSCSLVDRNKVTQYPSMKQLIAACADDICRLFSGGRDSITLSIVPDDKGNVWLREQHELSVLTDERWIDLQVGVGDGDEYFLSACGNGGRVYFAKLKTPRYGGRGLFGVVDGGDACIWPTHHTSLPGLMRLGIHDNDGALWVPISERDNIKGQERSQSQYALRLSEKGVIQRLCDVGWPKLLDQSGNVWLGEVYHADDEHFYIWRDGQIVDSVRIPGMRSQGSGDSYLSGLARMFSDRPGSVYALTSRGLQHLVTKDPARPAAYALGKLYTIPNLKGSQRMAFCSDLGFIAVSTYDSYGGKVRGHLYVIELPEQ